MSCEFSAAPTACRDGGMCRCVGRPNPWHARFLGAPEKATDSVSGASSDPSDHPAFLPRESEKSAPSTLPGTQGVDNVRLSSLTEAAPARKFKYPQGPQVPLHFSD